jgi:hypothetical protein
MILELVILFLFNGRGHNLRYQLSCIRQMWCLSSDFQGSDYRPHPFSDLVKQVSRIDLISGSSSSTLLV